MDASLLVGQAPTVLTVPVVIDYASVGRRRPHGALFGCRRRLDVVGVTVAGFLTGFGGGIVRDLLLGAQDVYFMSHPDLIWVSLAICLLTFYFRGIFLDLNKSILLADTLSVALFALAGSSKAFAYGLDPLYVVIMGVITAVGGGALRDSFAGIMPAIFRGSNYYAMACLGGSCVFTLLAFAGVNLVLAGFACVFAVLMLRYLSIRFNWGARARRPTSRRGSPVPHARCASACARAHGLAGDASMADRGKVGPSVIRPRRSLHRAGLPPSPLARKMEDCELASGRRPMSVDLKAISKKNLARDLGLIALGSLVFAVGLNCFMEPNGLAPGGISGLAITLRAAVLAAGGPNLPVGMQTLVMNALLMIVAARVGGASYVLRSLAGIILSSVLIDATAPVLPVLAADDLLLASLWGGVVVRRGAGHRVSRWKQHGRAPTSSARSSPATRPSPWARG